MMPNQLLVLRCGNFMPELARCGIRKGQRTPSMRTEAGERRFYSVLISIDWSMLIVFGTPATSPPYVAVIVNPESLKSEV